MQPWEIHRELIDKTNIEFTKSGCFKPVFDRVFDFYKNATVTPGRVSPNGYRVVVNIKSGKNKVTSTERIWMVKSNLNIPVNLEMFIRNSINHKLYELEISDVEVELWKSIFNNFNQKFTAKKKHNCPADGEIRRHVRSILTNEFPKTEVILVVDSIVKSVISEMAKVISTEAHITKNQAHRTKLALNLVSKYIESAFKAGATEDDIIEVLQFVKVKNVIGR